MKAPKPLTRLGGSSEFGASRKFSDPRTFSEPICTGFLSQFVQGANLYWATLLFPIAGFGWKPFTPKVYGSGVVRKSTLAEGRKAVACSHPLDPKSTQSLCSAFALPLLFVAFLSFFVFPWPSPLWVINVIIIGPEVSATLLPLGVF